jgi:hypothetical protein
MIMHHAQDKDNSLRTRWNGSLHCVRLLSSLSITVFLLTISASAQTTPPIVGRSDLTE